MPNSNEEQKWKLTCKGCGEIEKWTGDSFSDASSKIISLGWKSDRFWGGMVCPQCQNLNVTLDQHAEPYK